MALERQVRAKVYINLYTHIIFQLCGVIRFRSVYGHVYHIVIYSSEFFIFLTFKQKETNCLIISNKTNCIFFERDVLKCSGILEVSRDSINPLKIQEFP